MYAGKLVFAQVMEYAPWHTFRRLVAKYHGDFNVRSFSCLDQFLCMAFAQLTYRESLRDIEACLGAQPAKLYHLGIRGNVSRSALADANEGRDWRIYFEFAQALIRIARRLYAKEPLGVELSETVYALDSTTIDLCLSLFPWAPFRQAKAAVKLHTLLDLRGAIPTFIHISDGKLHDVNVLDLLVAEPGAFYVMDRGYLDFERLYTLHQAGSFFVTRAKSNSKFRRLVSRPVDRSTGLICDQSVELTVFYSHQGYPERLRRIRFKDPETAKTLVFLTNHFALPALTIGALYKSRWQVELFFRWIKRSGVARRLRTTTRRERGAAGRASTAMRRSFCAEESVGLQAGAQKYGYALFFLSEETLKYLDKSEGFEVGVGPSVVVADEGFAKSTTTTTAKDKVYAFIFDQQGAMAALASQGGSSARDALRHDQQDELQEQEGRVAGDARHRSGPCQSDALRRARATLLCGRSLR